VLLQPLFNLFRAVRRATSLKTCVGQASSTVALALLEADQGSSVL
jgi:hypothetical protein